MKKQSLYIQSLLAALLFFGFINIFPINAVTSLWEQGEEPFLPPPAAFMLAENNLYEARFILDNREKIALTNEQAEKIENLMLENETSIIRDSAEIKIQELRFASFLKSQTADIDRKQVEKYIREISRQKTIMIVHHINYLLDVKEVLTGPQLQKLAENRTRIHPLKNIRRE
jgi:hypothetical protein